MLDKKQREWVEKTAQTLGLEEATDAPSGEEQSDKAATESPSVDWQSNDSGTEHLDVQQQSAKKQYDDALKLLTPHFKRALPFDKSGALRGKINAAVELAKAGSYVYAHSALDDAGQSATALVSAQSTEHPQSSDLIGKPLPDKYKNEQFQKDADGQVMHGGEFRGDSDRRTNYFDDDHQDNSALRTDEQGRLITPIGFAVDGSRGYVVSQETGALHQFSASPNPSKSQDGYDLYDHHSSPIQGGSAAAAGEMELAKGVVRQVTDQSGHYRPTPEMTHQMVDRMQDQGVAMREQKLTMLDKDGNPRGVTREIQDLWNEVADYEDQRGQTADPPPYDPEMLKKKQQLQDLGVGPSNREARVDLTNPKSFVAPEEFEQVKGDFDKTVQMVEQKIGVKLNENHTNFGTDFSSVEKINDWIGIISRMAALQPDKGFVDPKVTRLQMSTEQFAQTGGNVAAIRGKEALNAQVQQRPQAGDPQEQQRMAAMVASLGGDGKLAQLGVKDPTKLSLDQKFLILSKGRIPEEMQKKLGKPPVASAPTTAGTAPPAAQLSTPAAQVDAAPEKAAQPPVSYAPNFGAGQTNAEQPPVSYAPNFGVAQPNAGQPPVSYAPNFGQTTADQPPVSYAPNFGQTTADQPPVSYAPNFGQTTADQPPVSYAPNFGAPPTNAGQPPVSYAPNFGAGQTGAGEAPVSYAPNFGAGQTGAGTAPVSYAPNFGAEPSSSGEAPVSYSPLGPGQAKSAPEEPEPAKLELSGSEEEFQKLEFSVSDEDTPADASEGDTSAPARQWKMRDMPKAGKELNLKSQRPASAPHPRQAEYDQLGGDQGLLEKLLPAWKHRNQGVLDKLLELNKHFKAATGAEKDKLSAAIKTLTTELDHRDRMPTLHLLAGRSIDEKLAHLKN